MTIIGFTTACLPIFVHEGENLLSSNRETTVKSMLPPPFDWCEIPAGHVILGAVFNDDSGDEEPTLKVNVPSFSMAKYPVTNAQFARFIEAGGYQNQGYWTKAGWKALQSGMRLNGHETVQTGQAWTEPVLWAIEQWNGADYPVVGISWYEAFAFCRWLSDASGAKISLPTETQWQRAAQGDDTYVDLGTIGRSFPGDTLGRAFPWGNDWDASRCNHNVDGQGIGRITPVNQYEGKGDSPFGVVDMAGNVWEWCLTSWRTSTSLRGNNRIEGEQTRVFRGGSWMYGTYGVESCWTFKATSATVFFHTDYRNAAMPFYTSRDLGFRISVDAIQQDSAPKAKTRATTRQKPRTNEAGLLPSSIATKPSLALRESKAKMILPPPFEWCEIPAGKVKLTQKRQRHKGEIFEVPAFYIAKYPITNAQFSKFVEAGGYNNPQWWTEAGWEAHNQDIRWDAASGSYRASGIPWTEPRDWQNPQFNGADQPVINLSWYETVAFCQWLSEISGEKIMLPTHQQWQRAAQGDDGRPYPWGAGWDADRCNNGVVKPGIGRTTPVNHYEGKGDSPFGVVDMAGNIKEWVLTEHQSGRNELAGTNHRKICSRSWLATGIRDFRVDSTNDVEPNLRGNMFGFRIARAYV